MSRSNVQSQPRPAPMVHRRPTRLGPRRCAGWLLLYALIVVYSSLVLGPLGFHFVPRDPAGAWHAFLATRFFDTGSDQRPDWIANLLMMVPFGLLVTGTFGAARGLGARLLGTAFALLVSLVFVLAVKYAQLFFPPRTVSLNYIIAQSIGATLVWACFTRCARRCGALSPPPSRRPASASCWMPRSSALSPSPCFPSMLH